MQKQKNMLSIIAAAACLMLNAGTAAAAGLDVQAAVQGGAQVQAEDQAVVLSNTQTQVQSGGQAQAGTQAQAGAQTQAGTQAPAGAQAQAQTSTKAQAGTKTPPRASGQTVNVNELMTSQERAQYYIKLRKMRTMEERDAYRQEHHKQMQERAKEQGKVLPDLAPIPEREKGKAVAKGKATAKGQTGVKAQAGAKAQAGGKR